MPSSKSSLRTLALTRRDALSPDDRAPASLTLAAMALPIVVTPGVIVAGYSPIRSELDPGALMQTFAAQGARLALPVIVARDQPLLFRTWEAGATLVKGQLGILEPGEHAPDVEPDILLVPLAAIDRHG